MARRSSTPPPVEGARAPDASAELTRRARDREVQQAYSRALAWGTVVALAMAVLTGVLRSWIWLLALEPIALGVVIGEAAAVPSSVRGRRPPNWSYAYVAAVAATGYVVVHLTFWLASQGFVPTVGLVEFLRAAPSATAAPFFQSVDLARQIALATGGATALKYWIWGFEGLLMAASAALAYRGGSIRKLKT